MTTPDKATASDEGVALRAIARMQWRVRLLRAARGAIEMSLYGVAFAVVVLLGAKTGRLPEGSARKLLWASLAFPLIGALIGMLRPVSLLLAAQILDRAYNLADRLANALQFNDVAPKERTPFMEAAIADAAEQAKKRELRARTALGFRWPDETRYVALMLVVLGGVAAVEFRTHVSDPPRRAGVAQRRDPLRLADDDVEAFRSFVAQMEQRQNNTEETRQALERFNRFIDQVAREELDREEAFRRLQELQAELESNSENDREALRDALRQLGNRMDQNETTRQLAEALQQADPRRAAEAMRQIAQQLRENRLSEQQRQDLQRALQRATQRENQQQLAEQLQRAREEVERMLRQQRERQLNDSERRNLRQRQRELERLTRENQRQENQRRQLQRLDRAMSQAMQDLMRDMAQAAQDMEEGAEDLNRMSNEQLSEQQMADLRQQLEDLRQRMRQQNGQGGQQQRQRLQRFAGQARGGVQPGGMQNGQGRPGGLRLVRGSGGGGAPMPGGGQGGQGNQPGQQGQGNDPGGTQAGQGHDENSRGASTSIDARMRTVNVAGQQSGQGPSRSQVIRTAAQEGFTGQRYREVHAEYWDHAREVVHAGEVPPGYRSYVRRYFQLIRPRD